VITMGGEMGDSGSRGRRELPGMSSQGGDRTDESAPEIRDQEVDLDGSRVHYLTAGDGPHLVLLHGLGDSARDWQWVMPALARRFRVIAPDFPGFGESDRPRAAYSPALFAEFVARFLDALYVPGAVVVGNSLGASPPSASPWPTRAACRPWCWSPPRGSAGRSIPA
jgi:predicted alpha/beta-fold hydrolase